MTAPVKITKALALRLLKEAVEAKGADYVDPAAQSTYDDCTYAKGAKPGCIVGHALYGVGLKPKALRELDAAPYTSFVSHATLADSDREAGRGVVAALAKQGVVISAAAIKVFAAAQQKQDRGDSWGDALTAAREA